MAITFVGSVSGATGNLTLSGVQEGDVCLFWFYRDGNTNTSPAGTTDWPQISGGFNNFQVGLLFSHVVTESEGTAGSVTSAMSWAGASAGTTVLLWAYRGVESVGSAGSTGASGTTITYPARSLAVTDGSSMVVAVAGHRAVTGALNTAPTGLTNRLYVIDATDAVAVHDGLVSAWDDTAVSIGGGSSGWRAATVELISAAGAPPPELQMPPLFLII